MAKRQNFVVGSTNPVTITKTQSELNNGWNKYAVLKAGDLDGVFNAVSDYSNDSSNEIANAIQALTGAQPTGGSQNELAGALQKMREDIETSSLTFKGYVATSAPSSSTYGLAEGNIWINASAMPTTFPVAIAGVWNGTSWESTTDTYTVKDFDFFRNINDGEGYYWFGGQWVVMSTDMSTTYFTLNQTSGKWEIKSNVNLPGAPTTTTPLTADKSTKIATTEFVKNALDEKGSGYNVGDTFFTMRNDNELNGAVECNGAPYNTTDFTGAQSIGALLAAGKVPYVSLSQYATLLSTQGSVGVFGWDGGNTIEFRVPSLNDIFVETGTAAQIGDYLPAGLPNITAKVQFTGDTNAVAGGGAAYATADSRNHDQGAGGGVYSASSVLIDASKQNAIYGNSNTVQPNAVRYRAMVQLATSASDEAVETCTGVLADVADLKNHRVIAFQAPTAANNYTWYRKYADGWVEQGGVEIASGSMITLPIAMADTKYTVQTTPTWGTASSSGTLGMASYLKTTASFCAQADNNTGSFDWQVSGMAAS